MIKAGDIRKGTTIEIEGNVFTVIDFLHVKPGKGSAFVRTKMKNVMTGQVLERTFNPTDSLTRERSPPQTSPSDRGKEEGSQY